MGAEGGSKIQAMSAGYKTGNTARVVVNDVDVLEKAGRGINVVVLAGQNHEVMYQKTYDTHASEKQSELLAADEASVPVGSVIVAVCKDECQKKLTDSVREIFTNMGAKNQ